MMIFETTLDACELLDADHLATKHLFVDYARLGYADPQGSADMRRSMALRVCRDLTVHAQIEEELFYPALREAVPALAPLLDEALQEHQEAKDLVARVQAQATAGAGPELDALVAGLACAVEHHVKEERDHLFPRARVNLDLDALGELLMERQQALMAAMPLATDEEAQEG